VPISAVVAAARPVLALPNAERDPDQAKTREIESRAIVLRPQSTRLGLWVGNAARDETSPDRELASGVASTQASGTEGRRVSMLCNDSSEAGSPRGKIRRRPLRGQTSGPRDPVFNDRPLARVLDGGIGWGQLTAARRSRAGGLCPFATAHRASASCPRACPPAVARSEFAVASCFANHILFNAPLTFALRWPMMRFSVHAGLSCDRNLLKDSRHPLGRRIDFRRGRQRHPPDSGGAKRHRLTRLALGLCSHGSKPTVIQRQESPQRNLLRVAAGSNAWEAFWGSTG